MALTGPITLMLAILLCVGTPVLAVVLWNRGSVGTPATLVARLLMRVVLIGLCQVGGRAGGCAGQRQRIVLFVLARGDR